MLCLVFFVLGTLTYTTYASRPAVIEGERRVSASTFDARSRFDVQLVAAAVSLAKQAKKAKSSTAAATEKSIFSRVDAKGKKHLTYYGLMVAGAMARTAAATAVHPLNVCKTLLQTKGGVMPALKWSVLSRGAGSQFIMSVPHGAINFAVTEVRFSLLLPPFLLPSLCFKFFF